jgi:prephenate dehydrogenase
MRIPTLAIIGVGLLGGSLALAARSRRLADRIVGMGQHPEALARACQRGLIDEGFLDIAPAVRRAQAVVVCTPVDHIVDHVVAAADACARGTMLTDVGSIKAVIVRGLQSRLPAGQTFIGSHPLAGSEKCGADHADAHLFAGRLVVVTPAENDDPDHVQRVTAFWQALGAQVKLMTPEDHDRAVAMTSHLPHLLAAALAGVLPAELHALAATGFRDTTRVAAGDPSLWTGILLHNREAILPALLSFEGALARFREALANGDRDAVNVLLTQGKRRRDALGS